MAEALGAKHLKGPITWVVVVGENGEFIISKLPFDSIKIVDQST